MPDATGVSIGRRGEGNGMPWGGGIEPPKDVAHESSLGKRIPITVGPRPSDPMVETLFQLLAKGQVDDFNKLRTHGLLDFKGRDLTGMNLKGVDLRNIDLTRAILRGCDFTDAKFQNAILDRADLSDTVLNGAKFYEASLKYAALDGVREAKQAEFQKARLNGATLEGGNFNGAIFNETRLNQANLTRAQFCGAHMVDVRLMGATLSEAVFDGANMQRARMFQANGGGMSFKGTNLVDAEAVQSYFTAQNSGKGPQTTFEGAWIKGFKQNGEIPEEFFLKAKRSELPPEGFFPASPAPSIEKILVNGIPGSDKVLYDQAMAELNELIGLRGVKDKLTKLMHHLMVSAMRKQLGEPELDYTLHAIYYGNPGTGKTTVARIVSKLFYALGAMPVPNLIEADRSKLVAEYQGQTARETNRVIDSAMGGTLIIDEAYALKNSDNDSYGLESIATITKRLEDDRREFACILTGYEREMKEFLNANSGLKSRFPFTINFEDYTTGEMVGILKLNLDKKHFRYTQEFLCAASVLIAAAKIKEGYQFGNGRTVRTAFEKMTWQMSSRLVDKGILATRDRAKLLTPTLDDLPFEEVLGIPASMLLELKELRWKLPDSEQEFTMEEVPLDGDFPCLTRDSFQKIEAAFTAAQEAEKHEKQERDYV